MRETTVTYTRNIELSTPAFSGVEELARSFHTKVVERGREEYLPVPKNYEIETREDGSRVHGSIPQSTNADHPGFPIEFARLTADEHPRPAKGIGYELEYREENDAVHLTISIHLPDRLADNQEEIATELLEELEESEEVRRSQLYAQFSR